MKQHTIFLSPGERIQERATRSDLFNAKVGKESKTQNKTAVKDCGYPIPETQLINICK